MTADPRTEHWLTEHGTTFTLRRVLMADVDIDRSHRNQARIGAAVDPQTAGMYVEAIRNGADFPPPVGYYEDGKFIFIDGNHRHAAYRTLGMDEIEAYVVDAPSETQLKMLTWDANTKHGKPTTLAERIEQAAWLVETGSKGVDAARALNIPPAPLYAVLQRIEVDKRLDRLGFNYALLSKSTRHTMARLKLDPVLLKMATLARDAKLSSATVDRIVKEVTDKTTEADQLAQIDIEKARNEAFIASTAAGKRDIPTHYRRLNFVLNIIDSFDIEKLDPTKLDATGRAALIARANLAHEKLNEIVIRIR